jgi:hypothetical protein
MRPGRLEWIGVRPARRIPVEPRASANLSAGHGVDGDRYDTKHDGPRQVTLIALEDMAAIAAFLGLSEVAPELLRRNLDPQHQSAGLEGQTVPRRRSAPRGLGRMCPVQPDGGDARARGLQCGARTRRDNCASRRGRHNPHRRYGGKSGLTPEHVSASPIRLPPIRRTHRSAGPAAPPQQRRRCLDRRPLAVRRISSQVYGSVARRACMDRRS